MKCYDDRDDPLSNLSLQDPNELLTTRDIGDYWAEKPPKRHIHVLVKPPPGGIRIEGTTRPRLDAGITQKSVYDTYKFKLYFDRGPG